MVLSVNELTFAQQVLDSPTSVLVYFWAPWCKPCLHIKPILKDFEQNCQNTWKIVSINADDNFRLVNTYRIRTLPTLLLFEKGAIAHRIEGFQTRDELRRILAALENQSLMLTSA
ncbi:MAG: thioredoxin family protein [Jaaginema sp. PMC 1079.18]|nr:thioredoxin family protein [Jaaginema sp. PMC 1080.18]MEC4852638.1 thioredoxin family protein [Jaaginema sp. PMC 1079.18]MEC4868754.1 thioredoxin family protein [Jaaginema sp. PMC 1078.18]